ncbi:MAG: peroxiredoxin [Bacteroidales bacterium]|nr:peroxiredoxin [Bacteroidales bacterium]
MLTEGTPAPGFALNDQHGTLRTLDEFRGKKVVLYFYSKDNTSGCTKQACGFSERRPLFTEKGAVVLGVSKDSVASHKRFEQNQNLGFTLLSDPEQEVIKAYDVIGEKKMYGKVTIGLIRSTYLIDEDGIIVKALSKVAAADNPQQMLDMLG